VLLAAVIILVSGLHSKGTAATNVDRHMQKLSHTRQTRHSMKMQSTPGQSTQSVTGGRQNEALERKRPEMQESSSGAAEG
jgi:uncharacterized membrane protein YjjP (DUF1212 family)